MTAARCSRRAWEVLPDEDCGLSPLMDALGIAKQLQSQHFYKAEVIHKRVRPPMVAPTLLRTAAERPNNSPSGGGVTYLDAASLQTGGFLPAVRRQRPWANLM